VDEPEGAVDEPEGATDEMICPHLQPFSLGKGDLEFQAPLSTLNSQLAIHSADIARITLTPCVPLSQTGRGERVSGSPSLLLGEGVGG
jgi:hypothetical protein